MVKAILKQDRVEIPENVTLSVKSKVITVEGPKGKLVRAFRSVPVQIIEERNDKKKVVALMKTANIPTYSDGYYHAYVHPKVVYDIQSDTAVGGWMDANKYTDSLPLLSGEIGRYAGIRFMESSAAHIGVGLGAAAIDVYSTYISGPDSYGFGDMQTLRTYYVAPGNDHADPLSQKGYVGWKAMFGCSLLISNGARYRRIESATNG